MCVFVLKAEGSTVMAVASRPDDCLVLTRDSVSCPHIDTFHLQLDDDFTKAIYGKAPKASPEVWKSAIHHLLHVFQPDTLFVRPGNLETGLRSGTDFHLQQGQTYHAKWNESNDCLAIERL